MRSRKSDGSGEKVAFYTGGLTPPTFHESCACTVIKEGAVAREEGAFSRVPRNERRIIYDLEEAVTVEQRGKGGGAFLRVLGN